VENIEKISDVEVLRKRVAVGMEKLVTAWIEIRKIEDVHEMAVQMNGLFEAITKLRGLCKQLEFLGYQKCLWDGIQGPVLWGNRAGCDSWPDGSFCWDCPMPSELIWENRLVRAKSPYRAHEVVSNDVIKFLEHLGGEI
jgi:hypothetical protein